LSKKIAILALQGDYEEHTLAIEKSGAVPVLVRTPEQIESIDGLILPGGESTVIGMLAQEYKLLDPLRDVIQNNLPVLATCAGLILLAKKVHSQKQGGQILIGGLDIVVDRNFKGSQINSFETNITARQVSTTPIKAMFIRPPQILRAGGSVDTLATYDFGKGEEPVLVQQRNLIGASFHTELGASHSLHKYFLSLT